MSTRKQRRRQLAARRKAANGKRPKGAASACGGLRPTHPAGPRSSVIRTDAGDSTFTRAFQIERKSIDEKKRTAEVSFSSEEAVRDFPWGPPRVLLHERKAVNLKPLRQVGAALFNHNPDRIIGRIEAIDVRDDRKGVARIHFDDDDEGENA